MKLRPIGNHIVVSPIDADKTTASGIILPETSKDQPEKGRILAIGKGKQLENGEQQTIEVKEGDTILFKKYSPDEFKIDGEKVLVIEFADVIAIIE